MTSVPTDFRPGSELLGYRTERVLGRGGMGVVYLAHQLALERMVALKLLAPELADDEAFRERFLRESRLAASLDHPNIVPVFDAGEVEGRLYIAMRYVEGSDLGRLIDDEGPLEPARTVSLLAPVADALDTAHARGLVHRDVKPSNILIDESERPYLADFGLSRTVSERGLVEPSHFAASLDYVAPEQIEGKPVGPAADVYALGCVLHECLTGRPPFQRPSNLATLFAHLEDPPPSTGQSVDPVLARALAKEPGERYGSCRELITEAADALGVRDVVLVRDRRPLVLAALGVLLLLAAALAAFFLTRGDGGQARPSTKPTLTPEVDSLQRIDPETNELAATLRLGSDPTAVATGEGGVWTIHVDDNRISKIDPRTNEVVATGSAPGPQAVTVGGGSVWVVTADHTVAQLDPHTGENVHDVSTPSSVQPVELAAFGSGAVWVANPIAGLVARINPASSIFGAMVDTGALKGSLNSIAAGEGAVWVSRSNILAEDYGVSRIDPVTNQVAATIPLRLGAEGISAGEGSVWVANSLGDSVSQIEPTTNRIIRTIRVGRGPIGVAADGGAVWVTNYKDGTVSRIDPKRGRVVATIKVGPNPDHVAVGEGGVWVTVHVR